MKHYIFICLTYLLLADIKCSTAIDGFPYYSSFQSPKRSNVSDSKMEPPPHEKVAEMARYIMHSTNWAAMATISSHESLRGQPFSNIWSVSDGPKEFDTGVPYLYLTDMELSCKDLKVNPHASLSMTLAETSYCRNKGYDPQSPVCPRLILNGVVVPVKPGSKEEEFARIALFTRHPAMKEWPANHKFYFGKLNVTSVCVLDYFGGAKFISPKDYFRVKLNPSKQIRDYLVMDFMK